MSEESGPEQGRTTVEDEYARRVALGAAQHYSALADGRSGLAQEALRVLSLAWSHAAEHHAGYRGRQAERERLLAEAQILATLAVAERQDRAEAFLGGAETLRAWLGAEEAEKASPGYQGADAL